MAGETIITVVGNLTADPELRTTGNGASVASFTIASTARTYNRNTGQFEDGNALFMRCSAWRDLAEHCASTLSKGMRVIAQGRLQQRSYQAQDGSNRTVIEMTIDEIGPSLRYATAQVTRTSSGNGQGGFAGRGNGGNGGFNASQGNGGGFGGNAGRLPGWPWQWRLQRWLSGWRQWRLPGCASAAATPARAPRPATDPWGTSGRCRLVLRFVRWLVRFRWRFAGTRVLMPVRGHMKPRDARNNPEASIQS